MAILTKMTCPRCAGSGSYSFNHLHGTKCYGCDGAGTVMADAVKLARQKAARDKREALASLTRDARIAEGNRKSAERATKYQDDPRIGPVNRARCMEFPLVAFEAYKMLELFDSGGKIHPSCIARMGA